MSYLEFGNGITDEAITWRKKGHAASSCESTDPNRRNTATRYSESKSIKFQVDINPPVSWSD